MYYTVSNDTGRQTFMKHTRKQVVNCMSKCCASIHIW